MKLSGVIAIMVDPEAIITRITSRRTCSACVTIINLALNPVENTHKCPNCGGELVHRSDDNEATVRQRIEEYHSQSEPLLEHYKSRGLLHPVEGLGTVSEVQSRIAAALEKLGGGPPCRDG